MQIHLQVIGVLLIILGLVHAIFPSYFDWKNELKSLNLVNKQLMYVHTFFIALVVLLIGVLCVSSAQELIETPLGRKVSLGLGIFWSIRFFFQFFVYSSELWRGKTFETIVHVLFSILWTYLSVVFWMVYLGKELPF